MLTKPAATTATEALAAYTEACRWIGEPGGPGIGEMTSLGYKVVTLAKAEDMPLESLVVDEKLRGTILADAAEYAAQLESEESFYASLDGPPEEDETYPE